MAIWKSSPCMPMGALGFRPQVVWLGYGSRCLRIRSRSFAMASTQQTISRGEAEETFTRINDHQKSAARLSHADEARTLLANRNTGFLSTISQKLEGFPIISMAEFATDSFGQPLLAISTLAAHTKNMEANPKCSLFVSRDAQDNSDTSITVIGEASFVSGEDWKEARERYLKKFPSAFWVDFGDFRLAKIKPKTVRFVDGLKTGHALVADIEPGEYQQAKVDPISQFSTPIASHMNKDHAEDTKAIVEHVVGVKVDSAYMLDVDSLGFYVKAVTQGISMKLRIPFPRPAEDRKDVKTLIVEMLNSAKMK